jgi:hypothetical protein
VTDEDSPIVILDAGRMELCWPFVMMHCSQQPANKKHISSVPKILVVETDVFALHIACIL